MDGRNDADGMDDTMLPGFRFHPTDEELVGFYLRRKIQQLSLPIELIQQVDIYKYDPWDLPKLAATGEKEWYFYCPRDRKYRNSTRPNRVTGAGFWKATGTDRPIYSSDGTKCIGLKKSLVFYRGRAAKGLKTDWMMHEFRLPSTPDTTPQPKKPLDKNFPAADSWAICRIFKKTNSIAQRSLSYAWMTPFPETGSPDTFTQNAVYAQLNSENISCTTGTGSDIQLCSNDNPQEFSTVNFSALNIPSCKNINANICKPSPFASPVGDLSANFMFPGPETYAGMSEKCHIDIASMLSDASHGLTGDISKAPGSTDFGGQQQQLNGLYIGSPHEVQESISTDKDEGSLSKHQSTAQVHDQWPNVRSVGFPFSLPSNLPDAWKPNLQWDSPPCPSELSTTYSANNTNI